MHRGHQNSFSWGGFKLTNFISNSPKILKELLLYGVSQKDSIVDLDLQNNTKTVRSSMGHGK